MMTNNKNKKKLDGVVVSSKAQKTIVVKVERKFKDSRYGKFVFQTRKYHAHDDKSLAKEGSKVTIIESKPYSRLKRWELLEIHQ